MKGAGFLASAVSPVVGSALDLVTDARKGRLDFSSTVSGLLAPFVGGALGLAFGAGALVSQGLKSLGVVPDGFGTVAGKAKPFVDPNNQNDAGRTTVRTRAPQAPKTPMSSTPVSSTAPRQTGFARALSRLRDLGPLAFLRPQYRRVRQGKLFPRKLRPIRGGKQDLLAGLPCVRRILYVLRAGHGTLTTRKVRGVSSERTERFLQKE